MAEGSSRRLGRQAGVFFRLLFPAAYFARSCSVLMLSAGTVLLVQMFPSITSSLGDSKTARTRATSTWTSPFHQRINKNQKNIHLPPSVGRLGNSRASVLIPRFLCFPLSVHTRGRDSAPLLRLQQFLQYLQPLYSFFLTFPSLLHFVFRMAFNGGAGCGGSWR